MDATCYFAALSPVHAQWAPIPNRNMWLEALFPTTMRQKERRGSRGGGVEENSFLHASTPDHRRAYRYCCMASKFELFASSQLHKTQGTSSVPTGPQSIPSLPFSHSSSLVWEWHDFA